MCAQNWPAASQVRFSELAPKLHVFALCTHNHVAAHSDQAVRLMQLVDGQNVHGMLLFKDQSEKMDQNYGRVGGEWGNHRVWLLVHIISLLVNVSWMKQFSLIALWITLAIIMPTGKCQRQKDLTTCLLTALAEAVGMYHSPSGILSFALSTFLRARQDGLSMTLCPTAF